MYILCKDLNSIFKNKTKNKKDSALCKLKMILFKYIFKIFRIFSFTSSCFPPAHFLLTSYLPVYLSIYLSIFICIYLSIFISIYLSIYLFLNLFLNFQGQFGKLLFFTNFSRHFQPFSTSSSGFSPKLVFFSDYGFP